MNRKARKHEGFLDLQALRGASGLRGSASCDADRSPVGVRRKDRKLRYSVSSWFTGIRGLIDVIAVDRGFEPRDERPESNESKGAKTRRLLGSARPSRRFGPPWFGVVRRGSIPRRLFVGKTESFVTPCLRGLPEFVD